MSRDPREWFANHLNIGADRKAEIYLELSKSAALGDAVYWLQLLFGSGIATLGLVLDSPAVIIGAMLISPLMGPILAAGLALAAGDVALGIRAVANIVLSCIVAVGFSMLLVGIMPFKEITSEIAARIRPSTLDLGVALFSGAIGSIAICRPARGVVTSVPGVAIAVALMPPLCVAGFGIGIAASVNGSEGWRIAGGGVLLFLTNLFAITFTSMLVFLSLHIDLEVVLERMRGWRDQDREMNYVRNLLRYLPASQGLRKIGSLPGRTLLISVGLLMIAFPLSRSMVDIRQEFISRRLSNEIRQTAIDVWNSELSQFSDGAPRSYIGQVLARELEEKIALQVRVFTNQPCTASEKRAYVHQVASRLRKPDDVIDLTLIEIPTASNEIRSMDPIDAPPEVATSASLDELQKRLVSSMEFALAGLRFPVGFQFLGWNLETDRTQPFSIQLTYFGSREIGSDAKTLIVADVRDRIRSAAARVLFRRIDRHETVVRFDPGNTEVRPAGALDVIGDILANEPLLGLELRDHRQEGEAKAISIQRSRAIAQVLNERWNIDSTRVTLSDSSAETEATAVMLKFVGDDSVGTSNR